MQSPPYLRRLLSWTRIALVCCLVLGLGPGGERSVERRARALAAGHERAGFPAEAWEDYRVRRAPAGEKAIPVERYLAALERMRDMPQRSTAAGRFLPSRAEMEKRGLSYAAEAASLGAWTSLGPGNVGGRTRALVIDPRRPRTMYAGGVAGGVWKTMDGGERWRPLDDLMANLAVNALALDPSNPDVLYAGTGEGTFPSDAARGAGIFKTTDGGATWRQLAATASSSFHYVNDVVVSPLDGRRLYAATWAGVWRSRDAGASWEPVLQVTGVRGCHDLALRPDPADDVLFASCSSLTETAVYRNLRAQGDDRRGWVPVLSEKGMGRTSLAVAPSAPHVVYALASSTDAGPENEPGEQYVYGLYAVFRSMRGGDPGSWTARVRNTHPEKLSRMLLTNALGAYFVECGLAEINLFVNQGWYDNVIAVDPKDPKRVWAGGIDLFRSDDGGRTWGLASYWWAEGEDAAPSYVHADQHALVFHPRYDGVQVKTLFATNDGGLFKTLDARAPVGTSRRAPCDPAASRVAWSSLNRGYGVTQFYHGAPFPEGRSYFGGTQDNGTVLGSDEAGPDGWRPLLSGDGGHVAIDPRNPSVLYAELPAGRLRKSIDGGATFFEADQGTDGLFRYIAPFVLDPNQPDRLWLGGSVLWRSDDGAAHWTRASTGLSGSATVLAVAPGHPDRVLAGTSGGYVYRTTQARTSDGRTTWPLARPRPGFVSSLAFDPEDPNVAYATYSTFGGIHVWKTVDGGATWTGLDGSGPTGLPDLPVHALVVDPARRSRLFLGTDLGVFVSEDGGAHWAVENTGFANVITQSLAIQREPGGKTTLFAFTHGRGAWRVEVR